MEQEKRAVYSKGLFPVSLGGLCGHLGAEYSFHDADPDTVIRAVTESEMPSIEAGSLVISPKGVDSYARDAVKKGAAAVLADHVIEGIPCVVVKDLTAAAYKINGWLYRTVDLPALIVTGSVGKTTVNRMAAEVLRTGLKPFYCTININCLVSMPYLLCRVEIGQDYYIQEMDESAPHNLFYSMRVLRPELVVLTNICESHVGTVGGKQALIDSVQGGVDVMPEDSTLILNADDPGSAEIKARTKCIRVGIHSEADCRARNIRSTSRGTEFDLSYEGRTEHIRLSVFGEHNIYNAMMAWVAGRYKGIAPEKIRRALRRFQNTGIRQNICRLGKEMVYADCYNASATSVACALKCFCELPQKRGKKIAVLGDIAEIKGYERETYEKIARAVDEAGPDLVVTFGKDSAMLRELTAGGTQVKHVSTRKELNELLRSLRSEGKNHYLFKASRVMALEYSIQEVFPTHYKLLRERSDPGRALAQKVIRTVLRTGKP